MKAGKNTLSAILVLILSIMACNLPSNEIDPNEAAAMALTAGAQTLEASIPDTTDTPVPTSTDIPVTPTNTVTSIPLPTTVLQTATPVGTGLTITWPAWGLDYRLYSATHLTPPIGWLPVTNAMRLSNSVNAITVDTTGPSRFFRLGTR